MSIREDLLWIEELLFWINLIFAELRKEAPPFSMPENFLHFRVSETEIQAVWEGLHCPDFQSDGKEKSPESLGITGVQDFSFWF